MNIEELKQSHYNIHFDKKYEINPPIYHTRYSIQFAIEVLKSLDDNVNGRDIYTCINDKIQELKQYLGNE